MIPAWTSWPGGPRPVKGHVVVGARFRDGGAATEAAGSLRWTREGDGGDVVAYRPVVYGAAGLPPVPGSYCRDCDEWSLGDTCDYCAEPFDADDAPEPEEREPLDPYQAWCWGSPPTTGVL